MNTPHVYIIYQGDYQCKNYREIARYTKRAYFIRKLKALGYEKYWNVIPRSDEELEKSFGQYHLIII